MGNFDPEIIDQILAQIAELKKQIYALQTMDEKKKALSVFESTIPIKIVSDKIQDAYDVINTQIEQLKESITTENNQQVQNKITNLISLKAEVPYHFQFGQKEQIWVNDKINAILN